MIEFLSNFLPMIYIKCSPLHLMQYINLTLNEENSKEKQFEVRTVIPLFLQDIKAHDAAVHNGQALKGTCELTPEFD